MTLMTSGAGLSELLPDAVQRAYAIEPEAGSTFLDAEHVVILMQENRSFDHIFGTLRGVRGFDDPRALRLPNGNSVFVQTDGEGNAYGPWRLDIQDTRITWMGSLPHSRESQVDAWNRGRHDGWLEAKRSGRQEYAHMPLTMGHYTREDLPFYFALADAFTVCDQNYCSAMSSTSPNRSYFWTGTIRDEQRADARAHIRNEQIDDGGLTWKTFPERLKEAGISWKSYQNELSRSELTGEEDAWLSNYGDNVLECFAAYNVEAYAGFLPAAARREEELAKEAGELKAKSTSSSNPDEKARLHQKLDLVQKRLETLRALTADAGKAKFGRLSEHQKALHRAAFVTNAEDPYCHSLEFLSFELGGKTRNMQAPKGDVLYQFRKDVTEGKLPTVSWLTASERFSDHPSSPWFGAWYISEVMNILTKNPDVWKKTIFILTYDENDGYFDHAPSFAAADPKQPESGGASSGIDTSLEYLYKEDELRMGVEEKDARTGPIGMGFRVPMMIASPWTRGGWVNSQLFDHTSTLMFLEDFIQQKYGKSVKEENIALWRRTIAGDLTSAFRPFQPNGSGLDFLDRDKFLFGIDQARYKEPPSNYHKLTAYQIADVNGGGRHSAYTPHQEPGTRPSCALPYELYAEGNMIPGQETFELLLRAGKKVHGERAAGAPFNVYLRNLKDVRNQGFQAATYAVSAGDTLRLAFPCALFIDSRHAIEVHAPNGFYRAFRGAKIPSRVQVETEYDIQNARLTGYMKLRVSNHGISPQTITIAEATYRRREDSIHLRPGGSGSFAVNLDESHGWYDFMVAMGDCSAHFAGRVETGRSSISDPVIGNPLQPWASST